MNVNVSLLIIGNIPLRGRDATVFVEVLAIAGNWISPPVAEIDSF